MRHFEAPLIEIDIDRDVFEPAFGAGDQPGVFACGLGLLQRVLQRRQVTGVVVALTVALPTQRVEWSGRAAKDKAVRAVPYTVVLYRWIVRTNGF